MSYSRTIFISASQAIEDFPKGIGSALALDYMMAWTSVWDPRLLAICNAIPEWRRCDTSGLDIEDALLVCPEASIAKLDQPLQERLRLGRNQLVPSSRRPRSEVVRSLLDAQSNHAAEPAGSERSICGQPDDACCMLEDFYAFGYTILQVQCMARKLRYSFNIDWMAVGEQILSAARASVKQDASETDRWLAAAFDSLSQERDRYCSQQGHLLELLLLASSTLGDSLSHSLETDRPITLYATTQILKQWQQKNSAAWTKLVARLEDKTACIAGGMREELLHPWLPEDALIRELALAREDCNELGISPARVWMRFSPAMSTNLATVARQFGFDGAIIAPLGGGTLPKKEHAKVRWQGTGQQGGIDCILGHVLDVADCETLLNLGSEMAQQLDYHQVPTLILAHWPGMTNPAFQDLLRATSRTPALGKWIDAGSYFSTTAQPYWSDTFTSLDFQHPLPKQPFEIHSLHLKISQEIRFAYWLEQMESVARLWSWTPKVADKTREQSSHRLASLRMQCERLRDTVYAGNTDLSAIANEIKNLAVAIVAELRDRVPCDQEDLFFNPTSHPRKVFAADYPRRIDPKSSTRILACDSDPAFSQCVVEVPAFGFVKIDSQAPIEHQTSSDSENTHSFTASKTSLLGRIFGSRSSVAQEDGSMANELMEIQIDPVKGHLRSLYVINKRGNRLSGQVAWVAEPIQLRNQFQDTSFHGLTDVQMKVIHSSRVRGTIQVSGKLGAGSCDLRYTLWHAAQWLEIEILGQNVDPHIGFPVWRMIWPSEAATLAAWSQGAKTKLPAPLQCGVELIEIDDAEHRIHFATCGLSMHRRVGTSGLASMLPVDRAGGFHARFAVGIDWANPWATAIDRMVPDMYSVADTTIPRKSSGADKAIDTGAWLARVNMPNLHFRWIDPNPELGLNASIGVEPVTQENMGPLPERVVADGCLWMVETAGKSGTGRLGCIRPIERAWRVDFRGLEYDKLRVEDGDVLVPFQGWDRFRIAICFKK
jgi:hypothetical protein